MLKNSNRKGLALGAAFAMVASLFAGSAPASANPGAQLVITPNAGPVGNFNGVLNEDFPIVGYMLPGISNDQFKDAEVKWSITRVSGNLDVVAVASTRSTEIGETLGRPSDLTDLSTDADRRYTIVTSLTEPNVVASKSASAGTIAQAQAGTHPIVSLTSGAQSISANVGLIASTRSSALTISGLVNATSKAAHLNLRAFSASSGVVVSSSPNVTIRVTMWVENLATSNGLIDDLEWSVSQLITLSNTNTITAPAELVQPKVGDRVLTASATVASLNLANLSGFFFLDVRSNGLNLVNNSAAAVNNSISAEVAAATLQARAGVLSTSFAVTNSSIVEGATFSVQVRYSTVSNRVVANTAALGTATVYSTTAQAANAIDLDVVSGSNAIQVGRTATVRANTTTTFKIGALTTSNVSVSALPVEVTFTATGATLGSGGKSIAVNGASTTSWAGKYALTTGVDGSVTFTVATSEFDGGEQYVVTAKAGNLSKTLTVDVDTVTYELIPDATLVSVKPGTNAVITYGVEDQWGETAPASANLRVLFEKVAATGMTFTDTFSTVAVSAGKVSFTFTPGSATRTGSPSVKATLQLLVAGSGGAYSTTGTTGGVKTVELNVTGVADAFSVSPVRSQSASVSYFPDTVSFKAVNTTVVNGGALVELSGPSALIFRETGKTATSSGKIALRALSTGVVNVEVASLLVGTHTITFKVGDVSTTSLLVVDAVSASFGVKIAFDKTSITAGETSVITGTLTDANGNPVDTTNETATPSVAVLVVGWTGKGLPFNTGSAIETDEKGQFKVNVLALAGDLGTGTITATYRPTGAAVSTKNVTATQVITIAAPAAVAAPEVNAVIGTFNGRWAVRVENAKGAVVSVKVGNRWVKYTSLNDNYLFSRKSRVGATLPVAVYVNGQLENVATITIK